MPPKRKGGKAPAKGGKKSKVEEAEPSTSAGDTVKDAISKLKAADQGKVKGSAKPDAKCPLAATARVYQDYDCMLNQTNIGNNNNKYYIIQALQQGFTSYLWTRWGRVGEDGMNALKPCDNANVAVAEFKKKFKDKTKNDWDSRASFVPKAGKYMLLEMDATEESSTDTAEKMAKLDEIDGVKSMVAPSKLDKVTQGLIKLIFDNDMFKSAMADLEIDVKKMPLGKISKTQIAKGFEVLEKIEDDLAAKKINRKNLEEHCSQFYTLVPHNFGRQRPSLIEDEETLKKKYDMLTVLGDIEIALSIQKEKDKRSMEMGTKELPNPLDINYELLQTDLELLDKKSKEFKVLEKYTTETSGSWRKPTIVDVWKVSRHGEDKRFAAHDKVGNRKLLWHGTNVAVVAAIMKGGLRIMPHSGGRVGKGIYFASENSKSAGYVRCVGNTGIMFLNEVVLGKEHHITRDDWTLDRAPPGYDCIIAKGHTEPDPKKDTNLKIDGKEVTVPQAKPINVKAFSHSSFSQSEYLIYKESQNRIRYMLKMQF